MNNNFVVGYAYHEKLHCDINNEVLVEKSEIVIVDPVETSDRKHDVDAYWFRVGVSKKYPEMDCRYKYLYYPSRHDADVAHAQLCADLRNTSVIINQSPNEEPIVDNIFFTGYAYDAMTGADEDNKVLIDKRTICFVGEVFNHEWDRRKAPHIGFIIRTCDSASCATSVYFKTERFAYAAHRLLCAEVLKLGRL